MEADGKFFSGQMLQSESSSKQKLASVSEKRKSSAEPPECDAVYMERRTPFVCKDEANYKLFGGKRIKLKQPGTPSLILLSNETGWLLECQTYDRHSCFSDWANTRKWENSQQNGEKNWFYIKYIFVIKQSNLSWMSVHPLLSLTIKNCFYSE